MWLAVRSFSLPAAPYHIIFTTKAFYTGNLGGRAGANAKCQAQADLNPDLQNIKPGATWKALIATSNPYVGAKQSITFRGDVYKLPRLKTDSDTGPPPALVRAMTIAGEAVGVGAGPYMDCTAIVNICSGRTANGITETHGAAHHWMGALRSSTPSLNGLPDGVDCSNWTSTAGSGHAAGPFDNGSLPDMYNDGSATNHNCNYTLPLLCINVEP